MFSYSEMVCLAKEVQDKLHGALFDKVQLVQEELWNLSFYAPYSLMLSTAKKRAAFYLDRACGGQTDTSFCHRLNEELKEYALEKAEIIHHDRILKITFQKKNKIKEFIAELFPLQTSLFLIDQEKRILASTRKDERTHYVFPENKVENVFDPHVHCTSREAADRIKQALIQEKKSILLQKLHHLKKKLVQKKTVFRQQLDECQTWEKVRHEGELIQTYFYQLQDKQGEVEVEDFNGEKRKLYLERNIPLAKQLEKRFKRAKKLQRGLEHLELLTRQNESSLEILDGKIAAIEKCHDPDVLEKELRPFQKEKVREKEVEKIPFKKYVTKKGFIIYAGRSDRENEKLSFSFADGLDYWLHVSNYPGSHVVIKNKKDQELDPESLQDALMVAIFHSKAKDLGEAEVVLTRCKELRKVKGKIGKVQIAKHKKLYAKFDSERFKRLVSQRGPHPLP